MPFHALSPGAVFDRPQAGGYRKSRHGVFVCGVAAEPALSGVEWAPSPKQNFSVVTTIFGRKFGSDFCYMLEKLCRLR
jgi:hypothetical protein